MVVAVADVGALAIAAHGTGTAWGNRDDAGAIAVNLGRAGRVIAADVAADAGVAGAARARTAGIVVMSRVTTAAAIDVGRIRAANGGGPDTVRIAGKAFAIAQGTASPLARLCRARAIAIDLPIGGVAAESGRSQTGKT